MDGRTASDEGGARVGTVASEVEAIPSDAAPQKPRAESSKAPGVARGMACGELNQSNGSRQSNSNSIGSKDESPKTGGRKSGLGKLIGIGKLASTGSETTHSSRRASSASSGSSPARAGSPSVVASRKFKSSALKMLDMPDLATDDEAAEDIMEEWSRFRVILYRILMYRHSSGTVVFDALMGMVILLNIALMIPETDWAASCEEEDPQECIPLWAAVIGHIFLSFYALELFMRLFVFRCKCLRSLWTVLDMSIVGIGILGIALAGIPELKRVNILRILRVARILRFIRILKRFPTLCNIIGGFVGAMQAMAWGIMMILLLLVAWSLFAVEFIHPINKKLNSEENPGCANAFQTVLKSTLLFFQTLVAGDSWGACSIPIIEAEPWTYFIFAGALVTVQLGFTNLVLAIIVDKAAEAREGSKEEKRRERAKEQVESFDKWREVMKQIDVDESGSIDEEELMEGYGDQRVKATLEEMNITKQDLRSLFHLMDLDGCGQLSYGQFLDAFHKAQVQDPKIYLMVMQLRMQKVERQAAKNYESLLAQNAKHHENIAALLKDVMIMSSQGQEPGTSSRRTSGRARRVSSFQPTEEGHGDDVTAEMVRGGVGTVWY